MDTKTQNFLDVTEAAERLVESLSQFQEQAHSYTEAEGRIREAAAASVVLAQATEHMAAETGNVVQMLSDLGVPTLRDDLSAVVQTTALHAAQMITQVEALAEVAAEIKAQRGLLESQSETLQRQREAMVSQAEALAKQHSVLVDQQQRLLEHQDRLLAIDGRLDSQVEKTVRVEEVLHAHGATLEGIVGSLELTRAMVSSATARLRVLLIGVVVTALLVVGAIVLVLR